MKDKDPKIDSLKEHPCGKCAWRSFTRSGIAGCYKRQKIVDKACDEHELETGAA